MGISAPPTEAVFGDEFGDACDNCLAVSNPDQFDNDDDGAGAACDCNDNDPLNLPGGEEICDNNDNNCDGRVDEDLVSDCGTGVCQGTMACAAGSWSDCTSFGDDAGTCALCDVNGNPAYDETQSNECSPTTCPEDGCGVDNCGTYIFGDYPDNVPNQCSAIYTCTQRTCSGTAACETDADGDGYCVSCGDCDDNDASRFLGNPEVCDRKDNDCNGIIPDDETDDDDDGMTECEGDCDDAVASCTNDCTTQAYQDADGDHYGNSVVTHRACDAPAGYVSDNTDCDDSDSVKFPGNPEFCDRKDNNCDGAVDEHDQTAPSTTSNALVGWQNTDITVDLSAVDETGCDIQATYYCIDQTNECEPDTLGTTVTVTAEGTNYVRYLSIDMSGFGDGGDYSDYGNVEAVNSDIVNIDKTSPVITFTRTPANTNGWNNADVVVDFECTDELSGVNSCTPNTIISTEGVNQSLTGTVIDKAGNSATYDVIEISIDKTNPVTTDDYAFDSIWTNNDAYITLSSTDELSGVDFTKYCIDNTGACVLDTDYVSGTIDIATEGTSYLRYASTDKAENLEENKQAVVMLDKTSPIGSIEVSSADDSACGFWFQWWIDNGAVSWDIVHGCAKVSAVLDDPISGVKTYTIKLLDSNGNIVDEKTDEPITHNFESPEKTWKVVVEAYDNAGNYMTISRLLYEDDDQDVSILNPDGGAPDLFDMCPAEVSSVDANKDGCQDVLGANLESVSWCVDTYSGRAASSLNPISVLTAFGTTYNQGSKIWNNVESQLSPGLETDYAINVIDKQGTKKDEIHCAIDANTLQLSSGTILTYTKKDHTKLIYKLINEILKVKESYHTHELSDGSRINAHMHYDENKEMSELHLTYNNEDNKKTCEEQARLGKDNCKEVCGKDNNCNKGCDSGYKTAADNCRDKNQYSIKQEYSGYKTLSVYDIMKLVNYE